jgi:hypothetical protein
MNPELVNTFENLLNRFLISSKAKDPSYYRSFPIIDDILQFISDPVNTSYYEVVLFNSRLNKKSFEIKEFLETLKTEDPGFKSSKDIIKQGSQIEYARNDMNRLYFNLSKEDGNIMDSVSRDHIQSPVVSVMIGQYLKFKYGKKVSNRFYLKDRFETKNHKQTNESEKMTEQKTDSSQIILSKINDTVIGPNLTHKFVSVTPPEKNFSICDTVSKLDDIDEKRYSVVAIQYETGCITINPHGKNGKHVPEYEICGESDLKKYFGANYTVDKNGANIKLGHLVEIHATRMTEAMEQFGWKLPPKEDNEMYKRWLLYSKILYVIAFRVIDIVGDQLYLKFASAPEGFPNLIKNSNLTDIIIMASAKNFVRNYTREPKKPNTVIEHITAAQEEDALGKKKRLEKQREKEEEDFDRSKGPYNLSHFLDKLIIIKANGVENLLSFDGKKGLVKEVDNALGRILIKFEYSAPLYFRESIGESKSIEILSDLVVSSEENPELV